MVAYLALWLPFTLPHLHLHIPWAHSLWLAPPPPSPLLDSHAMCTELMETLTQLVGALLSGCKDALAERITHVAG
jgi:hypothetical protein